VTHARLRYLLLAVGTIAAGLAVHLGGRGVLAPAARDVLGDALWAMMMAWWLGALAPMLPPRTRAMLARPSS